MPIRFKGIPKIVAQFSTNQTKAQLQNLLENNIWAKLESHINSVIQQRFKSGVKISYDLRVAQPSRNTYEIYPKFWIEGETDRTKTEIKSDISELLNTLKSEIKTFLDSLGVTNLRFHCHYTDGRSKKADEY